VVLSLLLLLLPEMLFLCPYAGPTYSIVLTIVHSDGISILSLHITCASNAVFSNNLATYQSTKGFLFYLFSKLINWKLTKQKIVTISSTGAELIILLHITKDLY
jgi:hypothetical protein